MGANFVSVPPDADMQAMELHVSALVFSADGRTLVTVDRRADGARGPCSAHDHRRQFLLLTQLLRNATLLLTVRM